MATYNMNSMMTNREMALAVLALPVRALGRAWRAITSPSARVHQLDALRDVSDSELAARGMTRAEAVNKVLCRYY